MPRNNRPQNACEFSPPRRRPSGPGWLLAVAGKGPEAFVWCLLSAPIASSSPLYRSFDQRYAKVCRQFVYDNGMAAILVFGHVEELDAICRLHDAGQFHPALVLGVWKGLLPVPEPILALRPLSGNRQIQIVGLDQDPSPKDELLCEVSRDAQINLANVRREPAAMGVLFLMSGRGRPEPVAAIEELHVHKLLPSRARSNVILSVISDDVGNPPVQLCDSLVLEFRNSRADQLRGFYSGVISILPCDHAVRGSDLPPLPGSDINARVEILMPRREEQVRDRLEQYARKVGAELDMRARVSWRLDEVIIPRPDLP